MQIGQSELLCIIDDDRICIRYVDATLHNARGDQYIVFLHSDEDGLIDGRSDVWDASGDFLSDRWLSSTVESMYGSMAVVKTVTFTTSRVEESFAYASSSWWDEYGGSIHPICQFGPDQQR